MNNIGLEEIGKSAVATTREKIGHLVEDEAIWAYIDPRIWIYIDIMRSKILYGNINLKDIYLGYGGYINYKSNILFEKFMRNIFVQNLTHT